MNSQHMNHIRDEISSLHLSYLQTEECLKKIGKQTKLEDVITQYLSLVPHIQKFFFPKINCVLHNSIVDNKDFSPFKAISAWSSLAKYAHNILTQPWRKEFYAIQKYGGYFSHVIKEVLIDWEIVFELMGYNTTRDIMILQEPIDPDKITHVARDCFIAQVECQIIMKIYENVLKTHTDCTWQDILEFRETYVCSADQAIRNLRAIFNQRQQDEFVRDTFVPPGPPFGYSALTPFHSTQCARYSDFEQTSPYGNGILNIPTHPKMLHDNKCDFNHLMSRDYPYSNCPKHLVQSPVQLNDSSFIPHYQGNRYALLFADKSMYPPFIYPNNSQYLGVDDDSDHWSNCHGYNFGMYPSYSNNKYLSNQTYDYHKQRSKNVGKYDNPVKQVPSDSLPRKNKESFLPLNVKCTPVTTDLENAMKAFSYDFDKNTISDNEQTDNSHLNNAVSESIPLPSKKLDKNKIDKYESACSDVWECKTCTFHNTSAQSICELCGKSRNVGNEKIPPIIGGRECHKCTLVNKRDALTCEACSTCLKDSPTYI